MAEFLKRAYNLVALKVALKTEGETANASCELQVPEQHEPRSVAKWDVSAKELGLPERLDPRQASPFKKPAGLIGDLRAWLTWLRDNHGFRPPLWLHLVKPYGYLGVAPWERWIAEDLNIPVLRLPDVVAEPPHEDPTSLDIILCASMPMAKEPFEIVHHLLLAVERIRVAVPHRNAKFDVFTDRESKTELEKQLGARRLLGEVVRLHEPELAESYAIPRRSSEIPAAVSDLDSPWLLWMRNALHGRSVDMVHFLCHGYFSSDRSALAFAQTPLVNEDPHWSRFVDLAELRTFLLQVGAWSAGFSSPETNYSDLGLRYLADSLAQERPGPVLYHDWRADRDAEQIAKAYRFLFAPEPRVPAMAPAVFLYCQPFRVEGWQSAAALGFETAEDDDLRAVFRQVQSIPNWMAASARYVEQCRWELNKTAQVEGERQGYSRAKAEEAVGVKAALAQIEKAVANLAKRRLKAK